MNFKKALIVLFLPLSLACRSTGHKSAHAPAKAGAEAAADSDSNLTIKEAQERKARLSEIKYKVKVALTSAEDVFTGTSDIQFELQNPGSPLRLDFYEGKIARVTLNGQELGPEAKSRFWISLPAKSLKAGTNTVHVEFTQEYSHQGQGLHKFIDPKTKQTFLYSQFETFDANRFMPCFDQPDLRAVLTLDVEAPADWQVISTTKESAISKEVDGRKTWNFPATEPIATYLFSLHAGPYKVFTDKFEDIPLRLFVRPSMANYLKVKEWFTYTKQGLGFYNRYFGMKYPFKKYDQLIVPEFNAGAMENVGAVTFSESFLWRSKPTRQNLRGLASVILHEMAHMWFGDIVTMKWWNDLWLNESFATFMSTMALAEATEFKEAWQDFFAADKNWAYWQDGLITTHPIEAPVTSVKDAFATFDGITYGKGAAVLKQLRAYITPQAFEKGIQTYIRTYAFKNAELKEFIGALQGQTDRNLGLWSERWLRQSGTDKIAAQWSCTGDTLAQVDLKVTTTPGRTFRPQTVTLALFAQKNGELKPSQSVRVDLTQESQSIKGPWPCPAFVYPNYQDDGYLAVSLDKQSLEYARAHLSQIDDLLLRTMVWDDLWEMVRHTEMPLREYVRIVNVHFPKETNPILVKQIVSTISGRDTVSVLNYWPRTSEKDQKDLAAFTASMEDEYFRRFKSAKAGSDDQRLWFDNYMGLARTPKAIKQLLSWSKAKNVAPGMPLDLDRQWAIVRTLSRYDNPAAPALIAMMKKKDESDRGQRNAMAAEAIQPKVEVKRKWVDLLKQPKPSISFAEARTVLRFLLPLEQRALAHQFEGDFYAFLDESGMSENENMVEAVADGLMPLDCTKASSDKLRAFASDSKKFSPSVYKNLQMNLDEDER